MDLTVALFGLSDARGWSGRECLGMLFDEVRPDTDLITPGEAVATAPRASPSELCDLDVEDATWWAPAAEGQSVDRCANARPRPLR